jgi:hypothetical protein
VDEVANVRKHAAHLDEVVTASLLATLDDEPVFVV